MSEQWFSCKGTCGGADPTCDTVKVNASRISNKENVPPYGSTDKSKKIDNALEQDAQRRAELQDLAAKDRQQRQEAREASEAAEAAKAAEEKRRRKLEEEERLRKVEEEEAARKAVQDAQLHEDARREAEEAERLCREAEAAEAAEKAIEEEKEMKLAEQQQVLEWCKSHGFQDVNVERKTFKGKKYPLHTAVKHQESEMVKLLIKCGARKDLKDSRGQTPLQLHLQLAQKLSKSGLGVSQAILDALQ